jgi:adenylate cyclase
MNTASRLESANKELHTAMLVSREAREMMGSALLRPMGRVVLRGRSTPVEIFEPVPAAAEEHVMRLTALLRRFDDGDASALADLESHATREPDDAALSHLLYRLRETEPGGYFVLE